MQKAKQQLGARLRSRRKAVGLTGTELGRLLGISQATVSKLETGQARVDEELVRAWIDHTADAEGADAESVLSAAVESGGMLDWSTLHNAGWREHQQRYDELERDAALIRVFQNALIPGLLQTARYARFLMREVVGLDDDAADAAVMGRIARQDLLYRPTTRLDVVVTEAVLRHRLGGAAVMAEQLLHLADVADLPTVSFRVIPVDTDMASRYGASFDLFEPAEDDTPAVVVVELEASEYREDDPARVARYRHRHQVYRDAALSEDASRDLVRRIAQEMRSEIFTHHSR
ncbi:helix-turn-helix transcriptional regulator [Pseudonocardia sp. NPDC049635]|uniref:helix-turn-helix domain-containing protein n=1 Tax=Pseudonocardia sp. NPDC049635 TaxID=3155506 RepID=UPI0033F70052